jgi:hypothetical protein
LSTTVVVLGVGVFNKLFWSGPAPGGGGAAAAAAAARLAYRLQH